MGIGIGNSNNNTTVVNNYFGGSPMGQMGMMPQNPMMQMMQMMMQMMQGVTGGPCQEMGGMMPGMMGGMGMPGMGMPGMGMGMPGMDGMGGMMGNNIGNFLGMQQNPMMQMMQMMMQMMQMMMMMMGGGANPFMGGMMPGMMGGGMPGMMGGGMPGMMGGGMPGMMGGGMPGGGAGAFAGIGPNGQPYAGAYAGGGAGGAGGAGGPQFVPGMGAPNGQVNLSPHGGWAGCEGPVRELAGLAGLPITSAKRNRQNTASGNTSDHFVGNTQAFAVDLGGSVGQMDQGAQKIGAALGEPGYRGGVLNKTINGIRYQVIYRSMVGGNHFDHIHVGAKRVGG